jgi:hypothetical protein
MTAKFKSESKLLEFIDSEIAWRKKEIIDLKSITLQSRGRVSSKALVLISYSHWEGFVKSISAAYLGYLRFLAYPRERLSERIIAPLILQLGGQMKVKDKISLLNDILCDPTKKVDFNIDRLVDTGSNLNFEVLEKIMYNIGTNAEHFDLHKQFIDQQLLGTRNSLAHGEERFVDPKRSIEIADTVMEMISRYKTVVENMISTKDYFKQL